MPFNQVFNAPVMAQYNIDGVSGDVNLTAQSGGEDLARQLAVIRDALAQSAFAANCLELEITESALLQESDAVLATLHRLRSLGLRIALDDFGTKYSSLTYLRSFPFDKIKIDQSFVRDMETRKDCLAIVQSVADLAAQLELAANPSAGREQEVTLRALAKAQKDAQSMRGEWDRFEARARSMKVPSAWIDPLRS